MSTMIQIRNVPNEVHRRLKARAASAGMSLSDYLLAEIRHVAERPTPAELRERLQSRSTVSSSLSPADGRGTRRARQSLIVLDASAVLEVLLRSPTAAVVEERVCESQQMLHLIDFEVTQVLRRYAASGESEPERYRAALDDLTDVSMTRYPHDLLLPCAWELCHNLTIHDAVYVALAEAVEASLLTCDQRLETVPGHRAKVEVV